MVVEKLPERAIMIRKYRCLSIFVFGFLVLGVPLSVSAQNLLEEVTVTAQKREQSVQDVGIAITAFTGDQMRALGVEESFDIAAFSPGVHISGNIAGQNTQFTIYKHVIRRKKEIRVIAVAFVKLKLK